jgi:hypothetical protein
MDSHDRPDADWTGIEQRLAAWTPAPEGLETDAMLFAAGRASARAGIARFVWPGATACSIVVVAMLGVLLANEHSQWLALTKAARPPAHLTTPQEVDRTAVAENESTKPESLAPDSYLAARKALESGAWPEPRDEEGDIKQDLAAPTVLRATDLGAIADR